MSEENPSKPRPRIQSLSDLIFGLALSISALTLINQQSTTAQQVAVSLVIYAFSFLILIGVWRAYSSITSVLPSEGSGLTELNIILLFTVSVEPYLFNELFAAESMFNTIADFYAVDLAVMFFIMAFFNHSLASEEKNLVPKNLLRKYRFSRNINFLVAGIFLVSTVPVFSSIAFQTTIGQAVIKINVTEVLWISTLILGSSTRFIGRRIDRREQG